MRLASLILLLCILFGCKAQNKQIRKAKATMFSYPDSFALPCSILFPIIPKYIQGKDSVIERTLTVKGDSIPCPEVAGKVVYVKCPDAKIVYKDVFRVDTIQVESTSKLKDLQNKFNSLQADKLATDKKLEDKSKQSSNRLWVIVSLGILLGGLIWFLIRR